jgi:hypothetical protein
MILHCREQEWDCSSCFSLELSNPLDILSQLSMIDNKTMLSSTDIQQYTTDNSQCLDDAIKFIAYNFSNYIGLNDVAEIACMTTNRFVVFLKKLPINHSLSF